MLRKGLLVSVLGLVLLLNHTASYAGEITLSDHESQHITETERCLERALHFLYKSHEDLSKIGMEYQQTDYPFRFKYPQNDDLGKHFVMSFMLSAYVHSERCSSLPNITVDLMKKQEISQYLQEKMKGNGLWSFDEHNISTDADTTMAVAISLLEAGIGREAFQITRDTLLQRYFTGQAFKSISNPARHSNFDAHPETTSNAVHFLTLLNRQENQAPIERCKQWLIAQQKQTGSWPGYWYPSSFFNTYRAVRALKNHEVTAQAIPFVTNSIKNDGGWGNETSNAFDTAYALMTLLIAGAGKASVEDGIHYLVSTQLPDGSWAGNTIFYFYYPQNAGKELKEEWHDRNTRLITTSLAVKTLACYLSLLR